MKFCFFLFELIKHRTTGAKQYVKDVVSSLYRNEIPFHKLILTKQLSKAEYKNEQCHTVVAKKIKQRNDGVGPGLGERVHYVMIANGAEKNCFKAEDPTVVIEKRLPLDIGYYVENQLTKPIMRLFQFLTKEPSALLRGQHATARCADIKRCNMKDLPVLRGLRLQHACLVCRQPSVDDDYVCGKCRTSRPDQVDSLVREAEAKLNAYRAKDVETWDVCRGCMQETDMTILRSCAAKDCPNLYARNLSGIEVKDAEKELSALQSTSKRNHLAIRYTE